MSAPYKAAKAIKALPKACDDSVALNNPKNVRADCIAYKYLRRCEGSRFFDDPLCTSLGHQRPGFAFACINDFCSQSVPGSSKCNDWMNYIQLVANGPRDDAKAVSPLRPSVMGSSNNYDKDNEEAGLRAFWYTSEDASVDGGRVCNKDIDGTVGGRVPSNAKDKYDANVDKEGVFYPVQYDRVMRSSRVCGAAQVSGSRNANEVWGAPSGIPLGTVMASIFGLRQYHTIDPAALKSSPVMIQLKHTASLPKVAAYANDIVSLIQPDMSDDASLPKLKYGTDAIVSTDGKTLTLKLDSVTMGKIKSGKAFVLFRHGGGRGCRCLLTPPTVSLASDSRVPYRKECVYGFCDTTAVGEIRVSRSGSKTTVHYPRRDYLSARDGTFVKHLSTSPPCATKITICETELEAKNIIMNKQSRIVNECGGSAPPPATQPGVPSSASAVPSAAPGAASPVPPPTQQPIPTPSADPASSVTKPPVASPFNPFSIFSPTQPSSSSAGSTSTTARQAQAKKLAVLASGGIVCVGCMGAMVLSCFAIMKQNRR